MKLSKYIDHTVLAADTPKERILSLCDEARQNDFASVCINSCWVKLAAETLADTDVNVCTVVGFPLGAMSTRAKAFEAAEAVKDGAVEIDMVINVGWLKSHMYAEVENDIREVKKACDGKLLKVIIETCLLTDEEKVMACELSAAAGADFVKTSTGFSKGGAVAEDVALMKRTIPSNMKVKASGGIRSYEKAMEMIEAGASRLGTSSGTAIISGEKSDAAY